MSSRWCHQSPALVNLIRLSRNVDVPHVIRRIDAGQTPTRAPRQRQSHHPNLSRKTLLSPALSMILQKAWCSGAIVIASPHSCRDSGCALAGFGQICAPHIIQWVRGNSFSGNEHNEKDQLCFDARCNRWPRSRNCRLLGSC